MLDQVLKYGKALVVAAIVSRYAGALAVLVVALAFALGDGGTLQISWVPEG